MFGLHPLSGAAFGDVGGKPILLDGISAQNPTVGTPTLIQNHLLTGSNILAQNPTLEATITQGHNFSLVNITSQPVDINTIDLTETNDFGLTFFGNSPVIDNLNLTQNHDLTLSDIQAQSPTVDQLVVIENINITLDDISAQNPTVGTSPLVQEYIINLNNIDAALPAIGAATLSQNHNITFSYSIDPPTVGALKFPFMNLNVLPETYTEITVPPETWTDT